ncbi:hypothetical protein GK047_11210 [Paenibacillus sp. SYP-B3998]|uniref:Uncharacterized protein n=1 Tax=Paenibacillus sp. SYP-B3998 TaxID=2678564 RepID=A0A6G3ZYC7_9BACL|nr:hypothetical protein [Paenibacillus sp. SYP-B3998]NEW06581.1 hypothetical protein [Paenibacillus sp. SYP-B3998]
MTTKLMTASNTERSERDVMPLVKMLTVAAWALLGIGLILSLFNINHFSDRNTSLMVGIGFMVGSVHIYVIRTAIHLVHSGASSKSD